MKDIWQALEHNAKAYAEKSGLTAEEISRQPAALQEMYNYQIFGEDIWAIPGDETESPFRFICGTEDLELFESEFRGDIPAHFVPFGYLHGNEEIVLLNVEKMTVHIIHVDDFIEVDSIDYHLENEESGWQEFIESIRPQTVACFINPRAVSEYDMFEILEPHEVSYGFNFGLRSADYGEIAHEDEASAWKSYLGLVQKSLDKGFILHYGPKKLQNYLEGK